MNYNLNLNLNLFYLSVYLIVDMSNLIKASRRGNKEEVLRLLFEEGEDLNYQDGVWFKRFLFWPWFHNLSQYFYHF